MGSMRLVCHLVPAVTLVVIAGGCSIFHGRCEPVIEVCCDDVSGAYVQDATGCPGSCPSGSFVAPSCGPTPGDAGTPVDSGTSQPLMCMPRRGVATCLRESVVESGQGFLLPVDMASCGCCPGTECEVAIDEASQTVRVTTTLCPDPCDCDACIPVEASCAVPALAPGDWNVVVNEAPAFTLSAAIAAPGLTPAPPLCATYARVDDCALSEDLDAEPREPERLCLEAAPGGYVMRMEVDCIGCGELLGPCLVRAEPRFTDDLPAGGELYVDTFSAQSDCDVDCPAICVQDSIDCRVPELEAGEFYRVWHQGTEIGSFTVGDGTECFEL